MLFFFNYAHLLGQQMAVTSAVPQESSFVWEGVATTFGGILLWLFKRDLDKRDKREEKMSEAVNTLRTHTAVLTNDVEKIRDDLDQLIKNR